jgi:hypothetical protein
MPSITLLPLLVVPRVAEDALTLAVEFSGDLTPDTLNYRVYPVGDPPPDYLAKVVADPRRGMTVEATVSGLTAGVEYLVDVEGLALGGGAYSASQTLSWTPDGVFPPADGTLGVDERPWSWEDFDANWLAALPWYYASDPMIAAIFARVGEEVQRLSAACEEVARFTLPSRAYGPGLIRWEQILGVRAGLTEAAEQERRQVVMSQLRTRLDHSGAAFVRVMSSLQGLTVTVRELFSAYTLNMNLGSTSSPEFEAIVTAIANRIKPAHLDLAFGDAFRADHSETGDQI